MNKKSKTFIRRPFGHSKIKKLKKLKKDVTSKKIFLFIPFYKVTLFKKLKSFLTFKGNRVCAWRSTGVVLNSIWIKFRRYPSNMLSRFRKEFGLVYKIFHFHKSGKPIPYSLPARYSVSFFSFMKQFISYHKSKVGQRPIAELVSESFKEPNLVYLSNQHLNKSVLNARKYLRYRW